MVLSGIAGYYKELLFYDIAKVVCYSIEVHCIRWYCKIIYGITQYCIVLYCIALCCMVLHAILYGISW